MGYYNHSQEEESNEICKVIAKNRICDLQLFNCLNVMKGHGLYFNMKRREAAAHIDTLLISVQEEEERMERGQKKRRSRKDIFANQGGVTARKERQIKKRRKTGPSLRAFLLRVKFLHAQINECRGMVHYWSGLEATMKAAFFSMETHRQRDDIMKKRETVKLFPVVDEVLSDVSST